MSIYWAEALLYAAAGGSISYALVRRVTQPMRRDERRR